MINNLQYDEMLVYAIQGITGDSTAKILSTLLHMSELECERCIKQDKSETRATVAYPDTPISFMIRTHPAYKRHMRDYDNFGVVIQVKSSNIKTLDMDKLADMLQEEELLGVRSEDLSPDIHLTPHAKKLIKKLQQ